MARAARVCPTPGCPALTAGGRCDQCRRGADRARDRHHYSDAAHRTFRTAVLDRDEVCVLCQLAAATVADHHPHSRRDLIAMSLDPNDPQYGRGLCKRCHDRETARHQPGGWHARDGA